MNYSVFLQVATSVKVCTCYRAGEKKQMIEEVMHYRRCIPQYQYLVFKYHSYHRLHCTFIHQDQHFINSI